MLLLKLLVPLQRLVTRLLQVRSLVTQRTPTIDLRQEIRRRSDRRCTRQLCRRQYSIVLRLPCLIACELPPHPAQRVGAGAEKISVCVFQIVFIQFQLCLQQIKLLLKICARSLRFGAFLLQLINDVLILLDLRFRSFDAGEQFLAFRRVRPGMRTGLTQSIGKRQIDSVIRESDRLLRQTLLLPAGSQSCHPPGGLHDLLIHDRGPART